MSLNIYKNNELHRLDGSGTKVFADNETIVSDEAGFLSTKVRDIELTRAEYDALPDSKYTDGNNYYITDEDELSAKHIDYDNSESGLEAVNIQDAIDELKNTTPSSTLASRVVCTCEAIGMTLTGTIQDSTYTAKVGRDKKATFIVEESGAFVITGTDMSASVEITYFGNYYVTLEPKVVGQFDYVAWLETAGMNAGSYATLDDVLDNEKGVRTLMTKTASIDYLVENLPDSPDIAEQILNDVYVAKWVNYREYAYSSLSAVPSLKTIMDKTGKYGMYITAVKSDAKPVDEDTVKALVPKLTSNTGSDGGVASASSKYGSSDTYSAYKAFDGDTTTAWAPGESDSFGSANVSYKFNNPTCVSSAYVETSISGASYRLKEFRIQASNDGEEWKTIYTGIFEDTNAKTFECNNSEYYMYYRLVVDSTGLSLIAHVEVNSLQFYGTQLDALIPTMTSNTAPSGVASAGSYYMNNNAYAPFLAMDGNDGTEWCSANIGVSGTDYIQYDFDTSAIVRAIKFIANANYSTTSVKISGSNDGTNFDVIHTHSESLSGGTSHIISFDNNKSYKQIRVEFTQTNPSDGNCTPRISTLQLYGKVKPQPKGLIPAMTSNTCEVGEVSASSEMSDGTRLKWHAFDGSDSSWWNSSTLIESSTEAWLQYKFTNPTRVNGFFISTAGVESATYKIQGSNDGTVFTDLTENISYTSGSNGYDISNENYYLYYRLVVITQTGSNNYKGGITTLQFYGYQLIPMVPTLTSNNSSDGTVVTVSKLNNEAYQPYMVFDNDSSTSWVSASNSTSEYLQVRLPSSVNVKYISITPQSNDTHIFKDYTISVSDDGVMFDDVYSGTHENTTAAETVQCNINGQYLRVSFSLVDSYTPDTNKYVHLSSLQFYGVEKWQPKGLVPVMTSNTAPYGEASASSSLYDQPSNYAPWKAFAQGIDKNNIENSWLSKTSSNEWIQYKFTSPTCVRKFSITNRPGGGQNSQIPTSMILKGSDDGVNFETLGSFINEKTGYNEQSSYNVDNDKYYLYYRLVCSCDLGGDVYMVIAALQFYGYQLEALVPPMTSNTAPVGEAFSSSAYNTTAYLAYRAFDNSTSTAFASAAGDSLGAYLGYGFETTAIVKGLYGVFHGASAEFFSKFKVQASNDKNDWVDLTDVITATQGATMYVSIDNNTPYKYYRMYQTVSTGGNVNQSELQFYGAPDYDSRTYIYDHGVELYENGSIDSSKVTKESDYVYMIPTTNYFVSEIDLTNFKLYSMNVASKKLNDSLMLVWDNEPLGGALSLAMVTVTDGSRYSCVDITNITGIYPLGVENSNTDGSYTSFDELWLE